jgi:hypothetical protein
MFSGVLKKRCINENTGSPHSDSLFCGGGDGCPDGYFCGKTRENPYYGFLSFDNVYYAFLAVFTSVTLEGWSEMMVMLQKTFNVLSVLYFIPLVFIGAWFLLNLTLAVIKATFT